jgi:hypothetical protein
MLELLDELSHLVDGGLLVVVLDLLLPLQLLLSLQVFYSLAHARQQTSELALEGSLLFPEAHPLLHQRVALGQSRQ